MESQDPFIRYVYFLTMIPGKKFNEEIIRAHVRHLKKLEDTGKLVLCGPFADNEGGMVILDVESYDEAKRIAESDPFVAEGYETYELRTLLLSCKENNHMGMG